MTPNPSTMIARMARGAALAAILAALATPSAFAHQHHHHGEHAAATAPLGIDASFDQRGRLWLASVRNGHVVVRHSDDLGATFSAAVNVNAAPAAILADGESHPDIAIGNDGRVVVSWSARRKTGRGIDTFVASSDDAGAHFAAPVIVNRDRSPTLHYFDALATTRDGRVVVAWIDARDAQAAKRAGKPYRGFAIYTAWSDDGGRSFARGRKLVDHSCQCCRLALARSTDGGVEAMFRMVYPGDVRDHALATLKADGQAAAARRVTFSGWQIHACPEQGPALAIAGDGTRHAVWYEAKHGPTIWYGQLDPGHAPRFRLKIGGAGASHADIAVAGNQIWIAWNQVTATGYTLMLRHSADGGQHFDAPRALAASQSAVYAPELLTRDGRAWVAWNSSAGFRLIPARSGQ